MSPPLRPVVALLTVLLAAACGSGDRHRRVAHDGTGDGGPESGVGTVDGGSGGGGSGGGGSGGGGALDGGADGASCTDDPSCASAGSQCSGDTAEHCLVGASGCLEHSSEICSHGCDTGACALGCAEWVYRADRSVAAELRGDVVYGADGSVLGSFDGSSVSFADGSLAGWDEGDLVYGADRTVLAMRSGSTVYDASNAVLFTVDPGGTVYDASEAVVGFLDDPGGCQTSERELLTLVLLGPLPL